MRKRDKYKTAILILAILAVVEGIFILALWGSRPKKKPEAVVPIPAKIKGKIAIVIDDWGYNLNNLHILKEIRYPLTVSILPNLSYSLDLAQELPKYNCQVLLHLPMEPYEKFRLEQDTIMTSMDDSAVVNIISRDLASISTASGVSNHMGSKATGDSRIMGIVFKELKKRGLYFLDSFVSSKTVCADLAQKMLVSFAKRDIFLDNKTERDYIIGQIHKLKTKANLRGKAIGIGHDRKITLQVLKELMPEIEKEGYRFVFVSELLK